MRDGLKTQKLSPLKVIVFSCIPLVVILLLGELSIRTWAYYFRTSYERYNFQTDRLELIPNTDLRMNGAIIQVNSKGFVGPEFPDKKASGSLRVFALGDSCTFGTYWKTAYPAILQSLLAAKLHDGAIEVINAGIEGYNSTYALARLKEEVLPYGPDVVIVYVGWNDLMKNNPASTSSEAGSRWISLALERSYLVKAYKKFIFYYLRPILVKPRIEASSQDRRVYDHFVPAIYKNNLNAMLDVLNANKVQVILVTRPTVVREGMSHADIAKESVVFPYFAGAYSLSQFLSLHDAYNRVVREVALSRNVPLVDLDKIVNERDKRPLFFDTMHPTDQGHELIAHSLAAAFGDYPALSQLLQVGTIATAPRE